MLQLTLPRLRDDENVTRRSVARVAWRVASLSLYVSVLALRLPIIASSHESLHSRPCELLHPWNYTKNRLCFFLVHA